MLLDELELFVPVVLSFALAATDVITSYSIHYTKLYEFSELLVDPIKPVKDWDLANFTPDKSVDLLILLTMLLCFDVSALLA